MDFFDILLSKTLSGGGGGGGGSSDFSTANVTITGGEEPYLTLPILYEAGSFGGGSPALLFCVSEKCADGTYPIALYKGGAFVELAGATTSGNIENVFDTMYLITGDCTVNFNSQ